MTEVELNAARALNRLIRDNERRLEILRTAIVNIVPVQDGMPKSSGTDSQVERLTVQTIALEETIADLRRRYDNTRVWLIETFGNAGLSVRECEVVMLRYVACMSYREIQRALNISNGHVFKVHRQAVRKLLRGITNE